MKRVYRLKERLNLRVGNVLTHIPYTLHHNCVHKFGVKDLGKQKQDRLVFSFTFMLSV